MRKGSKIVHIYKDVFSKTNGMNLQSAIYYLNNKNTMNIKILPYNLTSF